MRRVGVALVVLVAGCGGAADSIEAQPSAASTREVALASEPPGILVPGGAVESSVGLSPGEPRSKGLTALAGSIDDSAWLSVRDYWTSLLPHTDDILHAVSAHYQAFDTYEDTGTIVTTFGNDDC